MSWELAAENADLRQQLAESQRENIKLKRRLKTALGRDPRDRLLKILREKGKRNEHMDED